ncbi:MAG: hypothetical protein EBT03_06360 [Betaproteobacteria bacterium]|nr:hypothetical protein [Betaproteobacteria bacterium]NBT76002.1 hypothetical protein [Betaproteobacteria bacterium]NBY14595.1 hypothetical protein [Betaproteobacteria bacterium]NCA16705.1 hypothetical protein [Betaproteobacteria bacterium]
MQLNCKAGDLAIVVKAALPENVGTVVRVVQGQGLEAWIGFDEPVFVWSVELASRDRAMIYERKNGERLFTWEGPIPDAFLKPLVSSFTDNSQDDEQRLAEGLPYEPVSV